MRKNVCLWCIFGRWIQINFQNFSITHTFRSMLKGWNLLRQDTKVCFLPWAPWRLQGFLLRRRLRCVFNDVYSVMEFLGHKHNPDQWRLFIDSSKKSLKVVLLHNGNRFPSVRLAYATNVKESYESMTLLLGKIGMAYLSGSYVVIWRSSHCYWECNSGTQNTAVSCVSETAGVRRITM